jgi:hypothetical protein
MCTFWRAANHSRSTASCAHAFWKHPATRITHGRCGITASRTDKPDLTRIVPTEPTTPSSHYRKTTFIYHYFKFVGTDEYIQIIFFGFETNEVMVMFVGLDQAPMNIWSI